jgi:hypothetical protein
MATAPAAALSSAPDDAGGVVGAADGVLQAVASQQDDDDLQTIKAKTMFKMVEEIKGKSADTSRKLLFLSAKQADLIAGDPKCMALMLSIGFEIPTPRLVIQLCPSMGSDLSNMNDREVEEFNVTIDRFMADVLLPLACQTNAVVIGMGRAKWCALSNAFTRAMMLTKAKWKGKPPFTLISWCLLHEP